MRARVREREVGKNLVVENSGVDSSTNLRRFLDRKFPFVERLKDGTFCRTHRGEKGEGRKKMAIEDFSMDRRWMRQRRVRASFTYRIKRRHATRIHMSDT